MKLLLALLVAALLILVPQAQASGVRDCGNYGFKTGQTHPHWTYGRIDGAGTFNVTTRHVGCRYARHFVRHYNGTDSYYPRWRCREVNRYESSDIRCKASRGRVIRWQAGA